ncbi:polyhydroxyalkanoic acid synthase [Chitinimonas arctica]|uniref:Polyhydroxyalkanoic acid synthase n=1 Tax=Chitinimonas arctica TaxID=2594795 RepID=A0A516SJW4_9NEIS|nr:polyhydroxyalkanoic acid system family protein [Chitinimonas arctica]QDQ28449.1 polyhydroxyalkanoic acid synthase [Chitinimonas arctica]
MSIQIRHSHNKSQEEARKLAEQVAEQMKNEFAMEYRWDGDVLNFQRPGVSGQLMLPPGEVVMDVKLGFLLSAMKPRIEGEVRKFLTQQFG